MPRPEVTYSEIADQVLGIRHSTEAILKQTSALLALLGPKVQEEEGQQETNEGVRRVFGSQSKG